MRIFLYLVVAVLGALSNMAHARNCVTGKPCGNTCISWSYTCHVGTTTYTPTTTVTTYPPTAFFTLPQSTGVAPFAVSLNGSYSSLVGGTINLYQWSASNGQSATGQNASITFNEPGTYTITLTVTGSNGRTATSQNAVTVSAPPPPPVECANASYENGTLYIPALEIPVAFNQSVVFRVAMDYVMFSNPLEFRLSSAQAVTSTSNCRSAAYSPGTGVVAVPTLDVAGAGQFGVNLILVPGADPMRFQLRDAVAR